MDHRYPGRLAVAREEQLASAATGGKQEDDKKGAERYRGERHK
jgi:hypothetical protein